jgi:hypothetical protein
MALAPHGSQPGSPPLLYEQCDIPPGVTLHEYRHAHRRPHPRRRAIAVARLVRSFGRSRR